MPVNFGVRHGETQTTLKTFPAILIVPPVLGGWHVIAAGAAAPANFKYFFDGLRPPTKSEIILLRRPELCLS
ncbi:hypothetical protein D3C80_2154290 [compost metagenome]